MNVLHHSYLHSNEVTIEIQSDLPAFDSAADELLASAFIPGAEISREQHESEVSRLVRIEYSDLPSITENEENDLIVADDWSDRMPLHMVHLLYSLVQREHLARDNYTLHSSCVVKNDVGYLFIGHSGSGKTTSALEMVRKFDFRWYSGNKTLVEFAEGDGISTNEEERLALNAVAGTRPVTLEAVNTTGESLFQDRTAVPFVDRKLMLLKDEHEYRAASVKIGALILPRVNDGAMNIKELSPSAAAISLFPYFYDYFNMDIHMPSGEMYNAGFMDSSHRNSLKERLIDICAKVPVIQVSGSFDFMTDRVRELAD